MQIFCLGDSLTRGYGVPAGKDYPGQLQAMLGECGSSDRVYNFGIDGQDSSSLISRLDRQLARAVVGDMVLLLIGSNDALGLRLPVEVYRQQLQKLLEVIEGRGLKLAVATLPPIEVEIYYGEDPLHRLKAYNATIREVAQERSIVLVELAGLDVNLTTDGIHFGERGYWAMAELWLEVVT